jgi:hypothetical protein
MIPIIPMKVSPENVGPLIVRAYRESDPHQYIRELLQNSLEAEAKQVEFMPEWQAVERKGVWRLMVADNGCGMTPQQLERYLGEFGQGGKSIGGYHENYGIGAKSSTLPWNPDGVVIISYTPEFLDGAMIWLRYDSEAGMYGLRKLSDDGEGVVEPWDDTKGPSGIDWTRVAPEWVRAHGTVVILLGGSDTTSTTADPRNTFFGKKGDDVQRHLRKYINSRFWEIPEGVTVGIDEPNWNTQTIPKAMAGAFSVQEGHESPPLGHNYVYGAKKYVLDKEGQSGHRDLKDGTRVHWFLRSTPFGADGGYRPKRGYVAALYRNELYSFSDSQNTFRAWGIGDDKVGKRLGLIIEPMIASEGEGVFPSQSRAALFMQRASGSAELPWDRWREEFRENLPEEILSALRATDDEDDQTDERLIEIDRRIKERHSGENIAELRRQEQGRQRVTPERRTGPQEPHKPPGPPRPKRPRPRNVGTRKGPEPAVAGKKSESGLPQFTWAKEGQLSETEMRFAATWEDESSRWPRSHILGNPDFPPIVLLLTEMKKLWPSSRSDDVEKAVLRELEVSIVAKVAEFRGSMTQFGWETPQIRDVLIQPAALTLCMVGFASEQDAIKRQLTELLGKPRKLRAVGE